MFLRAALKELIFEFEHNFSGKLFQSLQLLTTNEFSAASTPTRGVRMEQSDNTRIALDRLLF
jgi:hypothetical protein